MRAKWVRFHFGPAISVIIRVAACGTAHAVTISVTTTNDSGAGSLRQAIFQPPDPVPSCPRVP